MNRTSTPEVVANEHLSKILAISRLTYQEVTVALKSGVVLSSKSAHLGTS